MKALWSLVLAVVLSGCTTGTAMGARGLPYDAWALGFMAPPYMEVWVEDAKVHDVRDRLYGNLAPGTVAIGYGGDPSGWTDRPGPGKGRNVTGADLPKRIYVRWQSLVEPQTYEALLDIPEEVRRLMLTKAPSVRDPSQSSYRNRLVVGLAPGGAIKVWVSGTLGAAVGVMCTQATVAQEGPYGGKSGGKHRPLSDRAAPYVAANSIPYASWKCDDE